MTILNTGTTVSGGGRRSGYSMILEQKVRTAIAQGEKVAYVTRGKTITDPQEILIMLGKPNGDG